MSQFRHTATAPCLELVDGGSPGARLMSESRNPGSGFRKALNRRFFVSPTCGTEDQLVADLKADALAGGASRHHLLDVDRPSSWHRRCGG